LIIVVLVSLIVGFWLKNQAEPCKGYSHGSWGVLLPSLKFYKQGIIESRRMEGTSGGLQYNLLLKAEAIRSAC